MKVSAAADNGAFAALLGRGCPRRIFRYVCGNRFLAPCDCTVLGGLIAEVLILPGLALGLLAAAAPAGAAGAWTTFVRPYTFTDVLARADTVWLGSQEAGLLRWVGST